MKRSKQEFHYRMFTAETVGHWLPGKAARFLNTFYKSWYYFSTGLAVLAVLGLHAGTSQIPLEELVPESACDSWGNSHLELSPTSLL